MNDNYQRLQLNDEERDRAEIIATLAAMQSGQLHNDLRLLNFYREVPVSYGAELLTIEENRHIELLVHQVQAVAIEQEKLTVLKSRHFRRDVAATASYVNVEKSRVVLTNLGYTLVRADRRMSVRVQLGETVRAWFSAPDTETVAGRLHDMSLSGMSMNVPHDPRLPLSQKGELSIALPEGTIAITASLLKTIVGDGTCRLVFEIEPTRAEELSISQYIFQRQVEIIKELKDHPGVTR